MLIYNKPKILVKYFKLVVFIEELDKDEEPLNQMIQYIKIYGINILKNIQIINK